MFSGACIAVTLVAGREYEARASFIPEGTTSTLSQLAGLAAQFGVPLGGTRDGESIEFYGELVRSREILSQLAHSRLEVVSNGKPFRSLMDHLEIWSDDPSERTLKAVKELRKRVSVTTDRASGLLLLRTTAPEPNLAEVISRRLLDLVNQFNLEKRQSQATSEREFVANRLATARDELHEAEGVLEEFLERNKSYQSSPQLAFRAARLQRRVDLRQQVFTSLAQAYEQARIDEVRNTPVITVVDRPEGSAEPSRRLHVVAALGFAL
jgi:uncharacterized protein involved in exopolysaccharide biosynthesis